MLERVGLILLDLVMPVMSGWDFLEKRKQHLILKNFTVVVMSNISPLMGTPREVEYLKKPVDLILLFQVVETHCGDLGKKDRNRQFSHGRSMREFAHSSEDECLE
jgi:CheY-like chemotaxis protein